MKKFVYVIILGLAAFCAFGQVDEKSLVMYELGSGYSVGINTNGSIPLEFRMIIPFGNFGFMLSGGADFAESSGGHGLIGATYFVINNDKIRVPVSLGFSISGNENHSYIGFSGLVSYQYILTNNIYIGFNMEINYNFNDRYTEIVSAGDGMLTNGVDGQGNTITVFPSPKTELTNHWGTYLNIRPTISIGFDIK